VVDQGFSVDVIRADLALNQGIVEPRELMMSGPAARVDVQGQLDLVKGHYDQVLVVAPRTSGALPLIGGLFGGPPAAAVLLMTQQIFRETLDQAIAVRYRVTGPFAAPVIERMQHELPDRLDPAADPLGMYRH
ncbi:MAG: AsmA-like C-terminal region-containing protein, partial [Ectothiorhodospiraceae bacterium]|nr:AsmA-like C-terminal region-containing protein [Ectothiorhodospiraceae bacterium]